MSNKVEPKPRPKSEEGNTGYPYYTIEELLPRLREISRQYGIGSSAIPRKDIAILLGKAEPTLIYFFLTCVQYGLLENVSSRGVIITDLFQQIEAPIFGDMGRRNTMIEALSNPPIYRKLIDSFNGKMLPDEEGLANLLKSKEYGVNSNSATRAAKIFYENGRSLDIIDSNKRLRYITSNVNNQQPTPPANSDNNFNPSAGAAIDNSSKPHQSSDIFELPIDLGNGVAYLKYPRNITLPEIKILKIMVNASISALEARHAETKND